MRIDADGHIGIGTDSPTHELEVIGNAGSSNSNNTVYQFWHRSGEPPGQQTHSIIN